MVGLLDGGQPRLEATVRLVVIGRVISYNAAAPNWRGAREVRSGLRRHIGLLVLVVLAGLVAACAGSAGPKVEPAPTAARFAGGPRLAVDNRLVDYGDVPFNKEVKATFQVKNVGDQRLTIKKVDVRIVQGC